MKKTIVAMIFILLITFSLNVFAKEKVELSVNKNSVESNDEITVSINFSEENLYAYTAKLSYDKDVFEKIETEDFQEQNNWAEVTYNSANNKFALIKKLDENQAEENVDKLVQVKLKVKDNAKAGKSTISVNSITASNGVIQTKLDSQSVEIEVLKEGLEENESVPSNKTDDIEEKDISVKVEKNVSPFSIILIILVIGIVAFLIWYDMKKENNDKSKIIITAIGVIIALILFIPAIKNLTQRSEDVNNNGTIDKEDTKEIVDYLLDIKSPKDDENIENKDVNNDGEISTADIARNAREVVNQRHIGKSVSEIASKAPNRSGTTTGNGSSGTNYGNSSNGGTSGTGTQQGGGSGTEGGNHGNNPGGGENPGGNPGTNPGGENPGGGSNPGGEENPGGDNPSNPQDKEKTKASITKAEIENEKYYVEKGQVLKIKYTVDSNKQEGLKGITLENNVFYPIESQNEDGTYTVIIPVTSDTQSGKATIEPIAVMYEFESESESETVILDETKKIEYYVLKDRPSIENYTFDGKTTVKFNFKNKENAIINKTAQIVVKDENGNSVTQSLNIKNADTDQGAENTLDLKDLENGNYTITLEGTFDLDDKENDGENEHSLSEIFEEKQIQVISKYTASIDVKEFKITKENESKKAVITFTCDNTTNEDVEWVVVNGTRYKANKQSDNTYIVEITDIENAKELQITDVVLKDDNQVQLSETKTYEIFKTKPTVTGITVNTDTDKVSAEFTVNDEASTITALKAVIKDSEGNQIGDPIDVKGKTNVEFTKPELAGKYTIEFLADFDCVDGENYKDVKINNEAVEFTVDLKVTANLVPDSLSKYIEKGKEFTLKYNIKANVNKNITAIEINGKEEAFNLVDGNYEITLTAPNEYGEKTYSITKIKFEGDNDGIAPENNEAKIYVLKTAPTTKEFKLNKDDNPAKISFYVVNDDLVRIDADAIIREKGTGKEIVRKEDITSGLNEIKLEKEGYDFKGEMTYELTFEGMYDLDGTVEPKENEHNIADILKNELFQLEINAKIASCEIPNPYVKKGGTVELKYTIESNTEIPVSHIRVNNELLEVKADGEKYSVTYTSKEEYGKIELVKANAVVFGDEEISATEREDKIQVLKRVPTVPKTYEIDENYNEKTITFKFDITDEDDALKENSTYVTLGGGNFKDEHGNERVPVEVGKRNEVTFVNVEPHRIFMLDVVGDYDLDTDELNDITKRDDNEYTNKALIRLPAMLFPPSELEISNIVAKNSYTGETIEYLNKNQEFKLSFTSKTFTENIGDTSNSFYPVSIKVEDENGNEKDYTLDKVENTFTTKESFTGYDSAGKKEIKIKSITLSNNEIVENDGNIKSTVEVLKDKVKVDEFEVNTNSEEKKATATVEITDNDNSFISGKLVITDTSAENPEDKKEIEIHKDQTNYDLPVTEFKKYKVELHIISDLDEDTTPNSANYTDEKIGEKEIELLTDYELKVSDLTVLSIDRAKTPAVAKLQFKSENKSNYKPSYVKVSDKEDYIGLGEANEKNVYTFEYQIDNKIIDENIETSIKIEKIKLENNTELDVTDLETKIFKKHPTANVLTVEAQDNTKIHTTFNVEDSSSTLKNLYVALRDSKGNDSLEQSLDVNAKEATFNVTNQGDYKVVIKGSYEAFDGLQHENEELTVSEQKASIIPNVEIVTGTPSNKYPNKGELIDITYKIAGNMTSKPTKVTINDSKEYELQEILGGDGTYKISYQAQDHFGLESIEVTHIQFENLQTLKLEKPYENQIDVLKAVPTLLVTKTEYPQMGRVVFDINITDEDDAMTSGFANVHNENQSLKKGSNQMIVQVDQNTEHTLTVDINYDLDTDVISEEVDQNESKISHIEQFTLVNDYGLKINNLRAVEKDTDNPIKYVNKGQQIQLRFESTNNTNFVPAGIRIKDIQNQDFEGVLYTVNPVEGKPNEYYADITVESTPGTRELGIENVILSGGSTSIASKDITFTGDTPKIIILKDKPTMENYKSNNSETSVTSTFTIKDPDKALAEDSKIKLIDDENKVIQSFTIHEGSNEHTFNNLVPGKKYNIEVENKYRLTDDGEYDKTEIFKTDPIEITKKEEPNFKVKNLSISKRVPIGEKVEVSFENAVMSYKDVDEVTIDNIVHKVSKDSIGIYKLNLDPAENKGVHTIQVQNAKIEGKEFLINRPLSYVNEFAKPEVTVIKDDNDNAIQQDGGKATVKYTLKDEDKSIRKLTAYMKTSSGAIVAKSEITEGFATDGTTENKVELPLLKLKRYSIELKATRDIGDGKTLEEINLFEESIDAPPKVAITQNKIDKEYTEKGEEVVLTFTITTNVDSDVKKIYVNGDQYNVEKATEKVMEGGKEKEKVIPDTYTVKVEAPKETGVFAQKVTGVEIGSDFMTEETGLSYGLDEKDIVPIKVLKDQPTVTHFTVNEQNKKLEFKVNDKDEAIVDSIPLKLIVKKGEQEIKTTEFKKHKGNSDYELKFEEVNINPANYPAPYNIEINSTFDRRPDAPQENILTKIMKLFTANEGENQEGEDENVVKEQNIFKEDITLTGNIDYDIQFKDDSYGYMLDLRRPQSVFFDCSTGTDYKVEKVIIDGEEYPVTINRDKGNGLYNYEAQLLAKSSSQKNINYEKIILSNGAGFDVKGTVDIWVIQAEPTFSLKTFYEDLQERKVRFGYKFEDVDTKIAGKLTFTLYDSQSKVLGVASPERDANMVEFDIPDPPTSVYKLTVTGDKYEIPGYEDYKSLWVAYTGEYNSSVTTSILSSEFSTKYPKKNETIEIIYNISSTKVVLVDKEDHSNQDKAVGISKLVINGTEYDVETLDPDEFGKEKYRIYYTVQGDDGIENVDVSKIIFTNGEEEVFEKKDQIEVLKDEPQVTDFLTETDIAKKQVTFKFNVSDPDNVIVTDGTDIYAEVNGTKQEVFTEKENVLTFDVNPDEMTKLEIKAKYDLDSDKLETDKDENVYEDHVIFTKPFILTGDYGIKVTDIKKYNSEGKETNYFEKNGDIKLEYKCESNWPEIYPETVEINNQSYTLEKVDDEENIYTTTIKADNTIGEKEINFNTVTLNSGNKISLINQKTTYEVLKDPVTVEKFEYTISDDSNQIQLNINIKDDDKSNKELALEVKDENDNNIEIDDKLQVGQNTINFERTNTGKYFASVYSTYDRDSDPNNSQNNVDKERIHYEIITVNTRYIEMKDIVDIDLYKYNDLGNVEKVDSITPDNLEPIDNCLVKVSMKDMPAFYSKLTNKKVENGKLKLSLEYEDAMVYDEEEGKLKPLEISLDMPGETSEGYEYSGSFKSLVERMRANPNEDITLDKDYDLSDYPTNGGDAEAIIDFEFKGKIHGNGHTISNLKKPIFKNLKDATIENLAIKKVEFYGGANKASLALYVDNTKISNVHVDEIILEEKGGIPSNTAGIAHTAKNHSIIEKCSVTNISYKTSYLSQSNSGIVVSLQSGSKVENCYVEARISSHVWCHNGGLVGNAQADCEMNNNIVKLPFTASYPVTDTSYGHGNGGIVSNSGGAKITNTISLIDGNGGVGAIYNPKRTKISDQSSNNYQLDTAVLKHENVNTISRDQINADFFRTKLKLDEKIWVIPEDASFDNLPKLKGVTASYSDEGEQPNNSNVYIPDYTRVKKLKEYDENKEIVYHNMYEIMPFYDAKDLINDGNKIPSTSELSTKLIRYIIPYNKEGKMVSSLTTETYNSLDKIRVVFTDGSSKEYHIDFDDYYGNVASYMISELKIGYNYNKYIVDANLPIVQKVIETAKSYQFKDLDELTTVEDSRLYKEEFETKTKDLIPEFVVNSLVNLGYTPNFESEIINNEIQQNLLDTNKLKEMLFAYNYFKHWYNLDMQGVNVADAVMFQSNQMFDSRMTIDYLGSRLITGENSNTNQIAGFYNNNIAFYTKINNLGLYLDHFVQSLTDYKDGNEWFKEHFKGGIYETVDIGRGDGVDYTIWDHFKKDGKVQRDILPLLTLPENSAMVVSSPTQVYYSALRVYMTNPNDPTQIANFKKNLMDKFTDQIKHFYIFAYDYWGADILNKYCDTEYDMRTTYTGRGNETVYNNKYTTEENYHKYFIEAIDRWAGTNGGAYANGNEVFWDVIKMVQNFRVGTHESLHNQDSKIFMGGYGRRGDAEDYAAGFMQQYYRDGWVSPNIFDEEPASENTTQNLHRSTVETEAKLAIYYKNYFNANDFLDYIEAQAFFTLSNEEKAQLVTQVTYPEAEDSEAGGSRVSYAPVTEDTVAAMDLNSMTALWDNHIMLRPGVVKQEIRSPGADTDSIFNIHWYQPHADNDRPDGASFKYNAWQMAGEKGYKEGLVAYYSQSYIGQTTGNPTLKTTDLIAIKHITGKDSWKQYKLDRYEELAKNYDKVGTYINAKEIYDKFLTALKADAKNKDRKLTQSTNVKRDYFKAIREATNDFQIDPFSPNPKAIINEEQPVEVTNVPVKNSLKDSQTKNEIKNTTTANEVTNSINTSNTANNVASNTSVVAEEDTQNKNNTAK